MQHLKGQHVLILGLGSSGLAMVKWCLGQGASVTVADTRSEPPYLLNLKDDCPQAKFIAGPFNEELLQVKAHLETDGSGNTDIRAVFKSPGLTPAEIAPLWNAAKEMGLWVGTELSLFTKALALLKDEMGYEPNVLGITGTNGKTTVTSLTAQMLSRGGVRTVVAGNIGPTLLDTLAQKLDEIKDIKVDEDDEGGELAVDDVKLDEKLDANFDVQLKNSSQELTLGEGSAEKSNSELKLEVHSVLHSQVHLETNSEQFFEAQSGEDASDQDKFEVNSVETESEKLDGLAAEDVPTVLNLPKITAKPEHKRYLKHRNILPQVWVLELSSFQLNDCEEFNPTASAILNISEDHLDWHLDMQSYVNAKAKIMGPHTHQILCRDDPSVIALRPVELDAKSLKKAKAEAELNDTEWFEREVITYGSDLPKEPGHYGLETVNGMTWLVKAVDPSDDEGERKSRRKKTPVQVDELIMQRLMPADALRIRGSHNALNALAALALCSTAKATSLGHGPMLYALREYKGEPHRVEPVMRINDVEYFDDSKGTNVGATIAAINGLGVEQSLIVVLGGEGKGQNFTPLAEPLSKHAKLVILIGRDAQLIKEAIQHTGIKCLDANSLQEAVQLAHDNAQSGDAVLMSPACASFDMFRNYEHRAEVFIEAVRALALEEGVV